MNIKENLPSILVLSVLAAGAGLFISDVASRWGAPNTVKVTVPKLSAIAMNGMKIFNENCGACHGVNASGSDQGPPLIHKIYNPGHHGDGAFFLAAQRGTRQHHWRFGDMPPQPQVKEADMREIIQYVRELQRANGINFQPHNM